MMRRPPPDRRQCLLQIAGVGFFGCFGFFGSLRCLSRLPIRGLL
jgi:hypothetical protein